MTHYIALLRGVNVSGRNKIAMSELKACFSLLGFTDIVTYLNSGNIVFSTEMQDKAALADLLQAQIKEHFSPDIPVFVTEQATLQELLSKAPAWWGSETKDVYDNLIFILPPHSVPEITDRLGEPSTELEQALPVDGTIFWSFDRKKYAKASWWKKTAAPGIGEALTIRTAGTVRKLAEL